MRHLGAKVAGAMFRAHYADLALMEDILRDRGLDWTISRPPKLTDKTLTRAYRTAYGQNIRGGSPSHAPTPPTTCSTSSRRSSK
jgi:hypothetical protein